MKAPGAAPPVAELQAQHPGRVGLSAPQLLWAARAQLARRAKTTKPVQECCTGLLGGP